METLRLLVIPTSQILILILGGAGLYIIISPIFGKYLSAYFVGLISGAVVALSVMFPLHKLLRVFL